MTLTTYPHLDQGTDEWLEARRGIITASVIGALIAERHPTAIEYACPDCGTAVAAPCLSKAKTPDAIRTPLKTLHPARTAYATDMAQKTEPLLGPSTSDAARALTAKLVAERITGEIEYTFVNADMERGNLVEAIARDWYSTNREPVTELGFMTREVGAGRVGYSPDGLVSESGCIEVKGPRAKAHLLTHLAGEVPPQHVAQIQCGLFVSGRDWCDYISWFGGMPPFVKRVRADERWARAIAAAVKSFERTAGEMQAKYDANTKGLPATDPLPDYSHVELKLA